MTLTVELNAEQADRLRDLAASLQVDPGTLARAAVIHFLDRTEDDFESAADRVLRKNHELYERLG
jgi:predicted transcriptional regulator